jgi:tripartite-type tricarboxylate transporter receptor subunit TctC
MIPSRRAQQYQQQTGGRMARALFAVFFLAGAMLLDVDLAAGQTYPARQVHMIVTFPPGGNADTIARLVADKLTQQLRQSVIVENKPGAASIVGTTAVVQAPADGHTLLQAGTNISTNPALGHKTSYDAERDLVPVALLVTVPAVVVVHPSLPVNTLAELVVHAKARPGEVNYGSAGNGSFPHLAVEKLAQETGIKMTHVPFHGFGPALIGLLRNDVNVLASDIPGALEHIRAGKLRALAVTGSARMPMLPDVPTVAEVGVPEYEGVGFLGIMVRAGTPRDVIDVLNREINRALATPEIANHIAANGLVAGGGSPEDFAAFLKRDKAIWTKVIATGGIKGE